MIKFGISSITDEQLDSVMFEADLDGNGEIDEATLLLSYSFRDNSSGRVCYSVSQIQVKGKSQLLERREERHNARFQSLEKKLV
mmetsp:Transcript_9133/g.30448  ORF Transcript_9133/g.30448 Transcript_9133/m.30448 type:complete len:84 (-) Transcript_9133:142-393(-)